MSDAPANPPPAPPPASKPGTRGAINPQRLQVVEQLLIKCHTHQEIERVLSVEWSCSIRTVQRYIARVHADWKKRKAKDAGDERERMRLALMDTYTFNYGRATHQAKCLACNGKGAIQRDDGPHTCKDCAGLGYVVPRNSTKHMNMCLRALHQLAYLHGLYDNTISLPKGHGGAVMIFLPAEEGAPPANGHNGHNGAHAPAIADTSAVELPPEEPGEPDDDDD